MSGSIEIPFEIGQVVWKASATPAARQVQCPECKGTRALTLIQGDGTEVSLACARCGVGYDPPTGTVTQYDYAAEPEEFICQDVNIFLGKVTYGGCHVDRLYEDKEECRAACQKLNEEYKHKVEEQAVHQLASKRRDMAWSVHYWGGMVRRLKKDLARAEARLAVCKEKKQEVSQ